MVEIVFEAIVLRQAQQVAVLHRDEVVDTTLADRRHRHAFTKRTETRTTTKQKGKESKQTRGKKDSRTRDEKKSGEVFSGRKASECGLGNDRAELQ